MRRRCLFEIVTSSVLRETHSEYVAQVMVPYFLIRSEPSSSLTMVYRDEPFSRVHGEHRESHAEVWRKDLVPAETLDFAVVGAGVKNLFHGKRL